MSISVINVDTKTSTGNDMVDDVKFCTSDRNSISDESKLIAAHNPINPPSKVFNQISLLAPNVIRFVIIPAPIYVTCANS